MNQPFNVHGERSGEPIRRPPAEQPYHPTDMRSPIGQPIRRHDTPGQVVQGDTATYVDPAGSPVPGPFREALQQSPAAGYGPEYQVPAGTAQQAAQERPTMTDQLTEETKPKPVEWPPNSPELVPMWKLSFKQRAASARMYGELADLKMPKPGQTVTGQILENYYLGLDKIDQFLESVAVDKTHYRDWVQRNDDEAFGKLWNAYQNQTQPGEASSSSS